MLDVGFKVENSELLYIIIYYKVRVRACDRCRTAEGLQNAELQDGDKRLQNAELQDGDKRLQDAALQDGWKPTGRRQAPTGRGGWKV